MEQQLRAQKRLDEAVFALAVNISVFTEKRYKDVYNYVLKIRIYLVFLLMHVFEH